MSDNIDWPPYTEFLVPLFSKGQRTVCDKSCFSLSSSASYQWHVVCKTIDWG